jgi:DNA repair exonuclease SbcCD nuclease subunit
VIIFAADLHMSPGTWAALPGLRGDAYAAWTQIIERCIELNSQNDSEQVHLILGGDIFDRNRPDSESVEAFISGVKRLTEASVKCYAIQGNHDRADPPWFETSDGVEWLHNRIVDIDGLKVFGLDNMAAEELKSALEELDVVPDVLVLHQMAKFAINIEGAWDFDPAWMPDGVRLVLMGDYHMPISQNNIWYSGSTHIRAVDEPLEKRILKVDPGLNVEELALTTRSVLRLRVTSQESLEDAVNQIGELHCNQSLFDAPLVVAWISSDVDEAYSRIREAAKDCHLLLRAIRVTEQVELPEKAEMEGDISPRACLPDVLDREDDPEFFSFVDQILADEDTNAVLAGLRSKLKLG